MLAIPLLLALGAPAAAAQLDLSASKPDQGCRAAAPGDLVVCGERRPTPYRLDPTVLDAERSKAASNNPSRTQDRSGNAALCGTVRNECSGGTIPLLEPALRVADAVAKAVQGDDWREAFRNGPSDYDRYEEARRKRSRISVGVSVGNGNPR